MEKTRRSKRNRRRSILCLDVDFALYPTIIWQKRSSTSLKVGPCGLPERIASSGKGETRQTCQGFADQKKGRGKERRERSWIDWKSEREYFFRIFFLREYFRMTGARAPEKKERKLDGTRARRPE